MFGTRSWGGESEGERKLGLTLVGRGGRQELIDVKKETSGTHYESE